MKTDRHGGILSLHDLSGCSASALSGVRVDVRTQDLLQKNPLTVSEVSQLVQLVVLVNILLA